MANDLLDNSMKETELGLLPSDWKLLPFGDVIEFESGQVDPRQEPYSSMLHVGPENIAEGSGKLLECTFASTLNLISGKYLFSPTDVLYSKIRPYLRKVALPDFNGVCSADMYPLRPSGKALTREYLYCWLLSDTFTRQSVSHQGRTGIPKINRQQLQSTWVVCPPVAEQQAIAHVLRTVQQAKEATEKVIAAARQLKQSLLRHLFTYGPVSVDQADKVPLKETEIGAIPEHWKAERLLTLLREPLRNGHSARATNTDLGIRTLTLTAVTKNDFSVGNTKLTTADADKVRGMWLQSGDIYVERANTPEYVGLAALYEGPDDFAIYPDLMIRVRVKTEAVVPKFLAEFMLTGTCRRYYQSNAKATAGNFPKIDQGVIEATTVPLPPMDEQIEMAKSLKIIDRKINAETIRRNALEAMFRTLLHDLMTGKVRVNELEFPAMKEGGP